MQPPGHRRYAFPQHTLFPFLRLTHFEVSESWLGQYCWHNDEIIDVQSNTWTAAAVTSTIYSTAVKTIAGCATNASDCSAHAGPSAPLTYTTHVASSTATYCPYALPTHSALPVGCPGAPHCPAPSHEPAVRYAAAQHGPRTRTAHASPAHSQESSPQHYRQHPSPCPGSPHCPPGGADVHYAAAPDVMGKKGGKDAPMYKHKATPPTHDNYRAHCTGPNCPPDTPTIRYAAVADKPNKKNPQSAPAYRQPAHQRPAHHQPAHPVHSNPNHPPVYHDRTPRHRYAHVTSTIVTVICPGSPHCPADAAGQPPMPYTTALAMTCRGGRDCKVAHASATKSFITTSADAATTTSSAEMTSLSSADPTSTAASCPGAPGCPVPSPSTFPPPPPPVLIPPFPIINGTSTSDGGEGGATGVPLA